jgi:hypothetical protein
MSITTKEQLNDFRYKIIKILQRRTYRSNWKHLSVTTTSLSPAKIKIQFVDVYQKEYLIDTQTPEEIAYDFERNLFEELYKLYRKGVIPNDCNH